MEMSCQHLSDIPSGVEGELLLFHSLSLLLSFGLEEGYHSSFLSIWCSGEPDDANKQTDKDPQMHM